MDSCWNGNPFSKQTDKENLIFSLRLFCFSFFIFERTSEENGRKGKLKQNAFLRSLDSDEELFASTSKCWSLRTTLWKNCETRRQVFSNMHYTLHFLETLFFPFDCDFFVRFDQIIGLVCYSLWACERHIFNALKCVPNKKPLKCIQLIIHIEVCESKSGQMQQKSSVEMKIWEKKESFLDLKVIVQRVSSSLFRSKSENLLCGLSWRSTHSLFWTMSSWRIVHKGNNLIQFNHASQSISSIWINFYANWQCSERKYWK